MLDWCEEHTPDRTEYSLLSKLTLVYCYSIRQWKESDYWVCANGVCWQGIYAFINDLNTIHKSDPRMAQLFHTLVATIVCLDYVVLLAVVYMVINFGKLVNCDSFSTFRNLMNVFIRPFRL